MGTGSAGGAALFGAALFGAALLGGCGGGGGGGQAGGRGAAAGGGGEEIEFADEAAARRAPVASAEVAQAEALIARGEADAAIAILERAIAENPRDVRAYLDFGLAHELREDVVAAERAYRAAIEVDAGFAEALNNLGVLLRDSGRSEEGIAMLRRAIEARPGFASAHLNLALALEDAGDLEGAEREYRTVIRLAPRDPTSRTNLAMILLARGQREEALTQLRRALPLAEGSRADLAAIGNGLRRAGDADLAVRALREAIAAEERPAPPGLRAELALAEYASGRRQEAEQRVRELIRDEPRYAVAHWVLANMLAARRAWREAAEQYQTFLRMAPDAPEAAEARARLDHVRSQR
jgi:Flp pilus assembly protein TadD